jgi:hypothetical protein
MITQRKFHVSSTTLPTLVRCEVLFGIKPRAYQESVRLCRCPSLLKTTTSTTNTHRYINQSSSYITIIILLSDNPLPPPAQKDVDIEELVTPQQHAIHDMETNMPMGGAEQGQGQSRWFGSCAPPTIRAQQLVQQESNAQTSPLVHTPATTAAPHPACLRTPDTTRMPGGFRNSLVPVTSPPQDMEQLKKVMDEMRVTGYDRFTTEEQKDIDAANKPFDGSSYLLTPEQTDHQSSSTTNTSPSTIQNQYSPSPFLTNDGPAETGSSSSNQITSSPPEGFRRHGSTAPRDIGTADFDLNNTLPAGQQCSRSYRGATYAVNDESAYHCSFMDEAIASFGVDANEVNQLAEYYSTFSACVTKPSSPTPIDMEVPCIHQSQLPPSPKYVKDIKGHQFGPQFDASLVKKWQVLQKKGCFKSSTLSKGDIDAECLPLMWVFNYKFDKDGYLQSFKA